MFITFYDQTCKYKYVQRHFTTYMILMPGACLSGRLSRRPDALAAWAELEESLEFKG